MKYTLVGLAMLLVLMIVPADAMAQKRQGNRGGQGRSQGGSGIQLRSGNCSQAGQSQRRNTGVTLHGNQTPNVLSMNGNGPDLLRMREEEKLARDVYTNLAKSSNLGIFRNISRAEIQHLQALERLIRSGANGANLRDTPGVFVYPEYQQLYTTLVASGSQSPLDALMVGAKIEEMDIADLQRLLTQSVDPQVRQVLEHLMRGSENHLRAFASQIAKQGGSYNAEFLSQTQFNQIANSSGSGHGRQSAGNAANRPDQGNAGLGVGQFGVGPQNGRQQGAGQKGRGRGNSGRQ